MALHLDWSTEFCQESSSAGSTASTIASPARELVKQLYESEFEWFEDSFGHNKGIVGSVLQISLYLIVDASGHHSWP